MSSAVEDDKVIRRVEPRSSLRAIVAGVISSKHSDLAINLDLFHKYLVSESAILVEQAVVSLFDLLSESRSDPMIWLHSLDDFMGDQQVVTFRIGHDGVLNKDTERYRLAWAHMVGITADLKIVNLGDGREEFVMQVPAAKVMETEPAPAHSLVLEDINLNEVS